MLSEGTKPNRKRSLAICVAIWITGSICAITAASEQADREAREAFDQSVIPFLQKYCLECHSQVRREAKLDLSRYRSIRDVHVDDRVWEALLKRLAGKEMPPEDAKRQPNEEERRTVSEWIGRVRQQQAARNAGDPGVVLPRRLSNAEYNYTIRDLTGADIRPAREFPVDPANEAGFDNSSESLAMSSALLKKYLDAARHVAEHLVLNPKGFAFAPHPVVTETDRDKYCVKRIVEFYQRQPTNYVDYFLAAWRYRNRESLGKPDESLADVAKTEGISAKYLARLWSILMDREESIGPLAELQAMWRNLPPKGEDVEAARTGCAKMRDFVVQFRENLRPEFVNLDLEGSHKGSQPFVLWKNRQYATHRLRLDRNALLANSGSKRKQPPPLVVPSDEAGQAQYIAACERFCAFFPDDFYISERGRDYVGKPKDEQEKGRLLSAGFHSMMGYFRDDAPLYELILSPSEQRELDALWQELDFITSAPMRQYAGFVWFERTDSRFMRDEVFDFARAEDKDVTSDKKIQKLAEVYLAKARDNHGSEVALQAIADYFRDINAQIRWVEGARLSAEPSHLEALLTFAARAYRRSLSPAERQDLLAFYHRLRKDEGLGHEEAIQDAVVSILMSPSFLYRMDLAVNGTDTRPLSDIELASRLSYFLWSSMPDQALMETATAGELHRPAVLIAQATRLLRADRVRGLATEFGGNWLDFRRFEEHNSADRNRFPTFTDALRQAMFEEPIRFFVDLVQHDRSVLDFLDGDYTFVNPVLARHYGMLDLQFDSRSGDLRSRQRRGQETRAEQERRAEQKRRVEQKARAEQEIRAEDTRKSSAGDDTSQASEDVWLRVDRVAEYQRGGLLPMSVFLTQNSPGLRTSPVKRGYWVVRRLLGEFIPPPPPNVPELPNDETKLGDLTLRETLARHREHRSCAGCHDRFDAIGLAFEGYGPIGERREKDLAGHPVDVHAVFPDGSEGAGLGDLRRYLREKRQEEYVDNLCRKLLAFALGRTLLLSDEPFLETMRENLKSDGYRFGSLVQSIISSPQFLHKRGHQEPIKE